jgi:hypothetical protein
LPFTHCINRQVVAAHRPILDFVQAVAACCCLSFPLSCAAVLHGAAGGDASPPIPSPQASALASSAHVPAAHRIALAAPCVPLATATHIVFGIACVVTAVCMCAGTRSVLPPKQQCTGHMLPSTASRAPGSHSSCPPTLYPCPCPQRAKHFRASDSTPRVRLYYKWQARAHAWGEWEAGGGVGRGRGRGMRQVRCERYVALLLLHGAPQVQAADVRQAAGGGGNSCESLGDAGGVSTVLELLPVHL